MTASQSFQLLVANVDGSEVSRKTRRLNLCVEIGILIAMISKTSCWKQRCCVKSRKPKRRSRTKHKWQIWNLNFNVDGNNLNSNFNFKVYFHQIHDDGNNDFFWQQQQKRKYREHVLKRWQTTLQRTNIHGEKWARCVHIVNTTNLSTINHRANMSTDSNKTSVMVCLLDETKPTLCSSKIFSTEGSLYDIICFPIFDLLKGNFH